MKIHVSSFIVILAALLVFGSCSKEAVSRVEREKLFTLSYGHFEDEIDLFQLDSDSAGPDTQLFMRDGMFYIANSGSKKVLQLTSFGDLLSVYYNPDANPVPSFASPASIQAAQAASGAAAPTVAPSAGAAAPTPTPAQPSAGQPAANSVSTSTNASTQKAIAYPFNHPVFVSVDSLKRLFVVDHLPQERVEFDNDDQVVLQDVVLRFGADGKYNEYLGQEGPGGTPFPPITAVYCNSRNETIVMSKTQVGIKVFWFDPQGALLFKIPVLYKNLPGPFDKEKEVLSSLEKIVPDPDSRKLYLKIDYYIGVTDTDTGSNAGISYDRSCIYPFDIGSGKYESRIDIPSYDGVDKDNLGTVAFKKPYEFLGITSSGWIFLTTPQDGGYALEVMDKRSHRSHMRILSVSDNELAYNALMLSSDGIISALLATTNDASVVWWRTDALIGEIRK